jgi:hypothetical protein
MTLSMYQASTPVFRHCLQNLAAILEKAEAYAADKKIDPAVLLQTRLFPDMFPLMRQVQIVSDGVKGCVARLAGQQPPSYPDEEKTFAELKARIAKTVEFIDSVPASAIDGSEDRPVTLQAGPNTLNFIGQDYLLKFALPNLFFHTTAVYAILRTNGVPIGKLDYLGKIG